MTFLRPGTRDPRSTYLATVPELTRRPDGTHVLQRPHFRVGQSLSAGLLAREAEASEVRQGRLGALLGGGVVEGLQVTRLAQSNPRGRFTIGPGHAIAANGQVISLGRTRELRLPQLARLQSNGNEGGNLRGVCVLLLRPVVARETVPERLLGEVAGFAWDQQRDRAAAPYVDARAVDGAEVLVLRLQSTGGLVAAPEGLNRAAHRIIDARGTDTPLGRILDSHIAVAVLGVTHNNGTISWIARHGAAEDGGGLIRPVLHPRLGTGKAPRQFRAAVGSLMEQMLTWRAANPGQPFPANRLRHLPAAGIVPAPGGTPPAIFPDSYDHVVAPLPESEMSAVLARAEALAPYDLTAGRDEVSWHLAVPDTLYDPELLVVPELPAIFDQAVDTFRRRVGTERRRRDLLRQQVGAVQARIDTAMVTDFGTDDDALDGESGFPVVGDVSVTRHDVKSDGLFTPWLDALPPQLITTSQRNRLIPDQSGARRGLVPFQSALVDALKPANDFIDFGFTRVQADIYRLRQSMLDNEESTKLATFPILAGIAKGSNALATNRSLREYFAATRDQQGALDLRRAEEDDARAGLTMRRMALTADRDTVGLVDAASDGAGGGTGPGLSPGPGLLSAGRARALAFAAEGAGPGIRRLDMGGAGDGLEMRAPSTTTTGGAGALGVLDSGLGAPVGGLLTGTAMSRGTALPFGTAVAGEPMAFGFAATPRKDGGTGGGTMATLALGTGYLSESYKEDNVYARLFEAGRETATEEYALRTLSDKQAGIKYADALPGSYEDLRTVTIADRLLKPTTQAARSSALKVKADAISQIIGQQISLRDLRAPLISLQSQVVVAPKDQFEDLLGDAGLSTDQQQALEKGMTEVDADISSEAVLVDFGVVAEALGTETMPPLFEKFREVMVQAQTPLGIKELAILTLQGALDPLPTGLSDESTYLTSAVSILESTVAAYRATEARVAAIQGLVEKTRLLIEQLREIEAAWRRELSLVERDLAEARHDLRLAMALRAEEQARVDALAAHRAGVLANHVRVAVFARPRRLRPHGAGLASARVLPGVYDDPLPDVLRSRAALPPELEQMMDVLGEVPLKWFAAHRRLRPFLKRPRLLDQVFHRSVQDARVKLASRRSVAVNVQAMQVQSLQGAARAHGGRRAALEQTLGQMQGFYDQLQARVWTERQTIDLTQLAAAPWTEKERVALDRMSLRDLIGVSRDARMAKLALEQSERIARVVSALLATFRMAPPAVRLLWGEALSAFDGSYRVLDATRLPGWSALEIGLRRDILRYVDWLNRQMTPGLKEASALMSDIIRVALLMASHSDVEEIVQARVTRTRDVIGGDEIEIDVSKGTPAIGGRVEFGGGRLAGPVRGKVVDLKGQRARVMMDAGLRERVTLTRSTQVFFVPMTLGRDRADAV